MRGDAIVAHVRITESERASGKVDPLLTIEGWRGGPLAYSFSAPTPRPRRLDGPHDPCRLNPRSSAGPADSSRVNEAAGRVGDGP
jgi:hypothetical protein